MGHNFHICLRSGPRGLVPCPPYGQPDRKKTVFSLGFFWGHSCHQVPEIPVSLQNGASTTFLPSFIVDLSTFQVCPKVQLLFSMQMFEVVKWLTSLPAHKGLKRQWNKMHAWTLSPIIIAINCDYHPLYKMTQGLIGWWWKLDIYSRQTGRVWWRGPMAEGRSVRRIWRDKKMMMIQRSKTL